jgi:DNA end-binding protein Ku
MSTPFPEPAPSKDLTTDVADMAPSAPRGRASWSGLLHLSLVTVPVKAYSAANTSHDIHFNQLHAGCGQRIRYEKRCPRHGKVEAGAIVSGYAYAPDHYIVIDQAEVEALRPAKERALSLERFLDPHQIDPVLFSGRTLYLVPDGLAAQHAYTVLTQTMAEHGKWALGRVVLSGHRALVLVRPTGHLLALHVLHFPAQIRSTVALEGVARPQAITPEERQLAGLLIKAASQPVAWSDCRDDTAEQLRTLIEAKLQGHALAAPAQEETPVLNLLDALKRSVAEALAQETSAQGSGADATAAARPRGRKKSSRRSA